MPQFQLDIGSPAAAQLYSDLDAFTQGYVEAMFFTDTGYPENEELEHATVNDLAPEAWALIHAECEAFQVLAKDLLDQAYARDDYSEEQAGRDFWLTRNGHGAGFWDRDQLQEGELGDALSALCGWRTPFRGVDLYMGDDGKVYLS